MIEIMKSNSMEIYRKRGLINVICRAKNIYRRRYLILVYNFEHDNMAEYSFNDAVKAGIYEDFEIDFSKIL